MALLQPGRAAPDFKSKAVLDGQFVDIELADFRGKYLVLLQNLVDIVLRPTWFYPLDFTFVCPTELIAFSDAMDSFLQLNCEVIACSTDSEYSHLAWVNTPRKLGGLGPIRIPLMADKTGDIARRYGCMFEEQGIAYRALFIINENGILRQITINDLSVGRCVEETTRLVQAFKFSDKHGEVCPVGWKPGKDSIKPDVNEAKAFFSKTY